MKTLNIFFLLGPLCFMFLQLSSQSINVEKHQKFIDSTVNAVLKAWNVPGCGLGIVVKNKLVFAKGYGYRNLEKKLPVTPNTFFQIASNTKLFTATAVGLLVAQGKLEWDKPVKTFVPQMQFYNDELNASVTIRDMLSHRTGISRHDFIWLESDFSRQELFDKIKYLEPSFPLRQGFLYNNLMYAAAGQIVENLSGRTWEEFVRDSIFKPLGMNQSMFVAEEMQKQEDFMTPYYEKRDTNLLLPYPIYTKQQGIGPAGSIISNINELSNWLIAQMNNGKFNNKQVIPASIIKETMRPACPIDYVPEKDFEILNSIYGMGRTTLSFKGHYLTTHSGYIGGISSFVSFMPKDSIGVIVFANRANLGQVTGIISDLIYDKLLGLEASPWNEKNLKNYLDWKKTERETRKKPKSDRILNTKPSHALADYAGTFENKAYGTIEIKENKGVLYFTCHNKTLPLYHYHYDRFMSPDDELEGEWSFLFITDAQGSISGFKTNLDQKEVEFFRKPDARLSDPLFLKSLSGVYELNPDKITVSIINNELVISTSPPQHLTPYKGNTYRIREFTDRTVEFILDNKGNPTGFKLVYGGKTLRFTKTID